MDCYCFSGSCTKAMLEAAGCCVVACLSSLGYNNDKEGFSIIRSFSFRASACSMCAGVGVVVVVAVVVVVVVVLVALCRCSAAGGGEVNLCCKSREMSGRTKKCDDGKNLRSKPRGLNRERGGQGVKRGKHE